METKEMKKLEKERVAQAAPFRSFYEAQLAALRAMGNLPLTLDVYRNLVDQLYDMEGFLDLQPIPIADMTGLQDNPEIEKEWLRIRKHGPNNDIPYIVGGSSVASILGISPWQTPLLAKASLQEQTLKGLKDESTAHFQRGHDAESYIVNMINRFKGFEDAEVFVDDTFYQHPVFDFMAGNIDCFIKWPKLNNLITIGEAKTTSIAFGNKDTQDNWLNGIIPEYYETQIAWYMSIMNMPFADIFCGWSFGVDEMGKGHKDRDLDFEKSLIAYVLYFIEEIVIKNGDPDISDVDHDLILQDLYKIHGDNMETSVKLETQDEELFEKAQEYKFLLDEIKVLKDQQKVELKALEEKKSEMDMDFALKLQELVEQDIKDKKLSGVDPDTYSKGINIKGEDADGKTVTIPIYYNSTKTARTNAKLMSDYLKNEFGEKIKELIHIDADKLDDEIAAFAKDFTESIKKTTTNKSVKIGKIITK